jgi:GNAT superfamily N-acetyltransferase
MYSYVVYRNTDRIADRARVVELVRKQLIFIGYRQTAQQADGLLRNAMKPESRAVLFVAYGGDGSAVAFAFGNRCCGLENEGDYLWLNELYVSEGHRHGGLGTTMLSFVLRWAKESGCVYMALVTHPKNRAATRLYESAGFDLESLVWVDRYL